MRRTRHAGRSDQHRAVHRRARPLAREADRQIAQRRARPAAEIALLRVENRLHPRARRLGGIEGVGHALYVEERAIALAHGVHGIVEDVGGVRHHFARAAVLDHGEGDVPSFAHAAIHAAFADEADDLAAAPHFLPAEEQVPAARTRQPKAVEQLGIDAAQPVQRVGTPLQRRGHTEQIFQPVVTVIAVEMGRPGHAGQIAGKGRVPAREQAVARFLLGLPAFRPVSGPHGQEKPPLVVAHQIRRATVPVASEGRETVANHHAHRRFVQPARVDEQLVRSARLALRHDGERIVEADKRRVSVLRHIADPADMVRGAFPRRRDRCVGRRQRGRGEAGQKRQGKNARHPLSRLDASAPAPGGIARMDLRAVHVVALPVAVRSMPTLSSRHPAGRHHSKTCIFRHRPDEGRVRECAEMSGRTTIAPAVPADRFH